MEKSSADDPTLDERDVHNKVRDTTGVDRTESVMNASKLNNKTGGSAANILVVDDVEANRDVLSRRLERSGHVVKTSEDGETALKMLDEDSFDLVLLDIMMPGMSGLEVLTKIRESRSAEELPVIMATAKTESADIVGALKIGANDYVTKPLDFPVVKARVQTQLALKRANEMLAVANERMKRGLDAAARIQRSGLPQEIEFPGYNFDWRFIPCDELAGDGLNIIPFDEQHIVICAWDVSGHGVPAALHSVSASQMLSPGFGRSSIMMTNQELAAPVEVLSRLNDSFHIGDDDHSFITLCYGILDAVTGIFTYSSAGHPYPIHVRDGEVLQTANVSGFPVGVVPSEECQYVQAVIELQPGDRLFFTSDGIEEATNGAREAFGVKAIHSACCKSNGQPLDESLTELISQLTAWHGSAKFDDDVSIIAVERLSTSE